MLRILLAILAAFLGAKVLGWTVFIAHTPYPPSSIATLLASRIQEIRSRIKYGKRFERLDKTTPGISRSTFENMKKVIFQPIREVAPGAYAQKYKNVVKVVIKKDEIEWVIYEFRVNGRKIRVRVPKGQKPPTQEEVEHLVIR